MSSLCSLSSQFDSALKVIHCRLVQFLPAAGALVHRSCCSIVVHVNSQGRSLAEEMFRRFFC